MHTKYSDLFKNILKLALPIIVGNLGFILICVGDVIVAGRHSTNTLAAISIATAIINCITTFGICIITSISPILSNYKGENKNPSKYFYPSLKFTFLLAIIISICILGTIPLIDKLNFDIILVPMIKDYIFVTAFSIFGAFLHCMSKEFLQSYEIVLFPNLLTVFGVFLNVALNILFVFGCGIIPEMGAIGLAISSFIIRYFMGIVLFLYCYKRVKIEYHKDFAYYKEILKVGLPSAIGIMITFVAFNSIAVIMGRISGVYAAVQNIVCTITSITFMVTLAISIAGGVKIGFCNGSKDYVTLKKYAKIICFTSIIFMCFAAIIVSLFAKHIVGLFSSDAEVIKIGIPIIYIMCVYQIFDGLQISLSGIFKGLKRTKIIMIANFIAYWLVALPLGFYFALYKHLNLLGFWYALLTASIVQCLIMFISVQFRLRKLSVNN